MVHQPRLRWHGRLDRADHHHREGHQLHRHRHRRPGGDHRRAGRGAWFTNTGNNTIGRITTAGKVTSYTNASIDGPQAITAGPDGTLWFTNAGDSTIGRITTAGKVTHYTRARIAGPSAITAGPDGALWFTNFGDTNGHWIGRITTTVTPGISGFTPASGKAGTTVTIAGQNLSGATKVAFNQTKASIVSDTATKIVTKVPAGATTGRISVTTPAGTATSSATFTVT